MPRLGSAPLLALGGDVRAANKADTVAATARPPVVASSNRGRGGRDDGGRGGGDGANPHASSPVRLVTAEAFAPYLEVGVRSVGRSVER